MSAGGEYSAELVSALVAEQFPHWAGLEVVEVSLQGWDNRTFRLGTELSVRLPSAEGYVGQVDREHRWLPFLGRQLTMPIPVPVARGAPSRLFPWAWSVYRWLDGEPLEATETVDLEAVAVDIAAFLRSLQALPVPAEAPAPGAANGFRGSHFDHYRAEAEAALPALDPASRKSAQPWVLRATESVWPSEPVWVHGDMAAGNLLTRGGRLSAVIDFGCMAVGDPACDLVVAWTILDERSRAVFRQHVGHDRDTWRRARGWAIWKAAITLRSESPGSVKHGHALRTVRELRVDGS